MRVEFAEDIVEQEKGNGVAASGHQLVTRQAQGERQRSLLALRGLAASIAIVEADGDIVSLRTDGGVSAVDVVGPRSSQSVGEFAGPRRLVPQ